MITADEARRKAQKTNDDWQEVLKKVTGSKAERELVDICNEIRTAASHGDFSVKYDYTISKETRKQLKSMGYKVKERKTSYCCGFANICYSYYIISWW